LIIVAALPIDVSLICLTTLNFRLATLLLEQSLLFLLLVPLLLPVTLTLRFNLSFRIGPAAILLLALRHFRAALFLLLPAEVCLSLLVGCALLILPLAFRLSLLLELLPALFSLRLPFAIPLLLFSLAALLIVIAGLGLALRLLVVVLSLVTASPVILSAHEDGRAQAERHNQ
jgi:hypothetical protein